MDFASAVLSKESLPNFRLQIFFFLSVFFLKCIFKTLNLGLDPYKFIYVYELRNSNVSAQSIINTTLYHCENQVSI